MARTSIHGRREDDGGKEQVAYFFGRLLQHDHHSTYRLCPTSCCHVAWIVWPALDSSGFLTSAL